MEMKRLREGDGCMLPCPGLLGSLVAADLRLPLKPEFMAKLGTVHGMLSLTVYLATEFLGKIASSSASDFAYCVTFLHSVVCLSSVTLVHPL